MPCRKKWMPTIGPTIGDSYIKRNSARKKYKFPNFKKSGCEISMLQINCRTVRLMLREAIAGSCGFIAETKF
jgi:hypothetical protein